MKTIDKLKLTPFYDYLSLLYQSFEVYKWNKRGKTPPTPQLIKQKIIKDYAREYSLSTFIETGTYLGSTTEAVKDTFSRIFTIELDKVLFKRAQKKFKKYGHIKIIQGDSARVLFEVLKKITTPALFWLDAHYSKGLTARSQSNTPIMEELKYILNHKLKNHIILVDDANNFIGENDYPTIGKLKSFILKINPNYKVTIKENIIVIQ